MESISTGGLTSINGAVNGTVDLKKSKITELQNLTEEAIKIEQKLKYEKTRKEYEEFIKAQTPTKN